MSIYRILATKINEEKSCIMLYVCNVCNNLSRLLFLYESKKINYGRACMQSQLRLSISLEHACCVTMSILNDYRMVARVFVKDEQFRHRKSSLIKQSIEDRTRPS